MRQCLRPGRLGRIEIEAGADAEIPAVGFARHVGAARAGVGRDQGQAQFGGQPLGAGLGHEGFFVAGQAGQVDQRGHGARAIRPAAAGRPRTASAGRSRASRAGRKRCTPPKQPCSESVWKESVMDEELRAPVPAPHRRTPRGTSCGMLWPTPGTMRCERGPVKRCACADGVGRRPHAVVGAVEGDRRHGDRRLRGQPALDVRIGRIARHQAEAVAVGVDHHVDEIRVVESRGAALEGRVVEGPGRRPQPPQQPAERRAGPAPGRARPRSLWK